jgi:hypothetical protein
VQDQTKSLLQFRECKWVDIAVHIGMYNTNRKYKEIKNMINLASCVSNKKKLLPEEPMWAPASSSLETLSPIEKHASMP